MQYSRVMTPRTEPVGFAIIQFLFWSALVTFEAFMVPYLRAQGYTPAEIGPIMSAVFGLAIVGQPLLGAVVDRLASPKRVIAGALIVGGLVVVAVPAVVTWYTAVLVIALTYSMTANSLPAVLDGWIMARREENPRINYGIARGFGSAGFAVGGATIGVVADRYGTSIIFPIYLAIIVVTAGFVLRVPSIQRDTEGAGSTAGMEPAQRRPLDFIRENAAAVMTNGPYLFLLIASYLAFVGLRAALTFLPILVEEINGGVSDVGLAHSVAAISETPFFFLSGFILLRIKGPGLIAALLAVLSVRLFAYTLIGSTTQLFVLQLTHGLTFGLFLAATVDYIHRIAPPRQRSFFQALAPSVYFGLGSITGSWLGGVIIERFSTTVMYLGAAGVALVGTILLVVATIAYGRRDRVPKQS